MHLRLHDDATDFKAAAESFYRRDPVVHTVELTLLRGGPLPGAGDPLLMTVWDSGEVVGAAMQTPPFPLLCNGIPLSTVSCVVDGLRKRGVQLSGVRGSRPIAFEFAQRWTGDCYVVDTEERLYRLATLRAPVAVDGAVRPALQNDTELLIDWQCAFAAEAFGHQPDRTRAADALRSATAHGDAYLLWTVDRTPVSLAGVRSPAAGVARVGPVFTPRRHRGRGYGSAITAAACRWAATAGAEEVVLFTDLANPVSNAIYQQIGFEPVTDTVHLTFAA